MPQLDMFNDPTTRPFLGVRVSAALPPMPGDALLLSVEGLRPDRTWTAVWMGRMAGIETDFLATFASETVTAWAWGERRDLVKAAASTLRAARAHGREHGY